MRILIDYKDEEFDLVCGEACHQDANDLKSNSGNSKLIQEGKEIQRNLAHIFYHYHVAVPQFEISFSGGFSVMDEVNCNFIGSLFAFRTSAEKLAIDMEKKLQYPLRINLQIEANKSHQNLLGLLLPDVIGLFLEFLRMKPLIVMKRFISMMLRMKMEM
ncbi:hypothetical protein INT48_005100 [Thamnidium elegans]|uniref:Uncharacterized protein n=1 Tax=Thamnidium elegans TaxID=101142 RepID=A0A8H7SV38_9FUNG|nr:hypothetical protein INT48_005100 [Thamnidium elegans]